MVTPADWGGADWAAADWGPIRAELDEAGCARTPRLLTPEQCRDQGHGLIFTTRDRPVRSARGWSASSVRHGVSTVRSGHRHTLGLVFHEA
jgi:hypothetical protein